MSDDSDGGFTLLEMVCVIALIAMLAAVLLPYIPRQTSRARLQAYALQTATLLKADRNAAIRRRGDVTTLDTGTRPNPLIGSVDHLLEVEVRQNFLRKVRAGARDTRMNQVTDPYYAVCFAAAC